MATIRPLPSGKYSVMIRRRDRPFMSASFDKISEAKKWAKEHDRPPPAEGESETSQATSMAWLFRAYRGRFTPNKRSQKSEISRLNMLSRAFGSKLIGELRPGEIVDWVEARAAKVKSDTVRKDIHTLSIVIDAGIGVFGLPIDINPVKKAKQLLKQTKILDPSARRDRRLTPDEEKALLGSQHGNLWSFFIETAMRRGEVANIRREHWRGNVLDIPETKTGVPRTIPLLRRAREILGRLTPDTGGFMWGVTPETISTRFKRACVKYGIKNLRLHDLRHEATSRLFERKLPIERVAIVTGHKDWKALKIYTHLDPAEIADQLDCYPNHKVD